MSGQKRKAKIIYIFFHPTDPARAEINKNEFPAHFICGMMMDLETNVSVHGTDIETETSRTALDDQNADPSKYCHLHFILNMSNLLVKFNPQEYVSTFYTDFICFTFRAIGLSQGRYYSHATFSTIRLVPCLLQKLKPWCIGKPNAQH